MKTCKTHVKKHDVYESIEGLSRFVSPYISLPELERGFTPTKTPICLLAIMILHKVLVWVKIILYQINPTQTVMFQTSGLKGEVWNRPIQNPQELI